MGVPVHDDQRIFEFLLLESFQAGLSWEIVLKKREGFRDAFAGFRVETVARFDNENMASLRQNPAIIRNKLKIAAAITNARQFLKIQESYGSFDAYIWRFVDGSPVVNQWRSAHEVPATSRISDQLSADLKQKGFKFIGSTVCYAHMQATGMVNDHLMHCFRYDEVQQL